MAVTSGDQRNTVSDEDRSHTDGEFIDRLRVQKRGDEVTASHQPDILARFLAQTAHERADRLAYELHPRRGVGRRRMAREDDGPAFTSAPRSDTQARLVGLPA